MAIGKKRKHDVDGNESPTEHLISESRRRSKGEALGVYLKQYCSIKLYSR